MRSRDANDRAVPLCTSRSRELALRETPVMAIASKRVWFRLPRLVAAVLALCVRANAAEVTEKEGAVAVVKRGSDLPSPAERGAILVVQDRLGTADASRAVLKMSRGWYARVDEESNVEITKNGLALLNEQMIRIDRGRALIYVRESKGEWKFHTPAGTGTGKGTQIFVEVFPNGLTFFQVIEGRLSFSNEINQVVHTLELNENEAGEATATTPPHRTAVIETRNLLQWALYYPAVLQLDELELSAAERQDLRDSILAYRLGDLRAALDRYPTGHVSVSDAGRLYHAGVGLASGQVSEARALLAQIKADNPGRRALERMIAAVLQIDQPDWQQGKTAGEVLAESYYHQSRRQLDLAREAARRSTEILPDSGYCWIRLAELEFSFGRTAPARSALERGLVLSPRHAQAHALMGYLLSAENKIRLAEASFERAVELDGALGNGWLGLGLTRIKRGRLAEGRSALQNAVVVEPTRALFYSYHAKAVALDENASLAAKDLAVSKQLDPSDPTPWLYAAIHAQQANRYHAAIAELQQSLRLNDNRRVFRSQLLLDQDRAMRVANLARIYANNGLANLAVREATRAVESDYTNASAHQFLANSFDAVRDPTRVSLRFETAWFNEQLLATLLAPVSGGPLAQFVTHQEYSTLLEKDGVGLTFAGEWRSDGQREVRTSVYGARGRISGSLDFAYFDRSASPTLEETVRREMFGQLKYQVGADDVIYGVAQWQDLDIGEIERAGGGPANRQYEEKQNPGLLLAGWSRRWTPGVTTMFLGGRLAVEEKQRFASEVFLFLERDASRFFPGFLRYRPDGALEYSDLALRDVEPLPVATNPDGSPRLSPAFLQAIAPFLGGPATSAFFDSLASRMTRRFVIHSGELQQIWQHGRNTLIGGLRGQEGQFDVSARLDLLDPVNAPYFPSPPSEQTARLGFRRWSGYVYDYFNVTQWLTLLAGASRDWVRRPENYRTPPVSDRLVDAQRTNAKAGFTLAPSPRLTLRGVYAESLGGVSFDESVRLEPVQLMGFVQAFRTVANEAAAGSVETPTYRLGGLSAEGQLPKRTWWSASFTRLREAAERTRGTFDVAQSPIFPEGVAALPSRTPERLGYREDVLSGGINQLFGETLAVGASYRETRVRLRQTFPEIPPAIFSLGAQVRRETLRQFGLNLHWNSPTGAFGHVEVIRYLQRSTLQSGTSSLHRSSAGLVMATIEVGWRFARSQRQVSLGVMNLGNFSRGLAALTGPRELASERAIFLRYRVSFSP